MNYNNVVVYFVCDRFFYDLNSYDLSGFIVRKGSIKKLNIHIGFNMVELEDGNNHISSFAKYYDGSNKVISDKIVLVLNNE